MSQKNLILLTGATGFIGFRTLILALQANYPVRCAIRDPTKSTTILSNPAIKSLQLSSDALTFVTVPDLTAPGAYDTAIRDVTYVIHIASPLPSANPTGFATPEESFIRPAVQGAIGMLAAAQHTPTVRRVVITSSVVALVPGPVWTGDELSDATYTPSSRLPTPQAPFTESSQVYRASKIAQLHAVEEWTRKHTPTFDVSTIYPSWVLGRHSLASSVAELWASTNKFPLAIATGTVYEGRRSGATVHVDDAARAHVLALGEKVEGGKNFIVSSSVRWEDIPGIVEKHFPAAVADGRLSREGGQATAKVDIRGEETEEVLGFRYLDFEEQVRSGVEQYLELKGAETAVSA